MAQWQASQFAVFVRYQEGDEIKESESGREDEKCIRKSGRKSEARPRRL